MKISRRAALGAGALGAGALGLGAIGWSWGGAPAISSELGGADFARGHRLRDGGFPEPSVTERRDIVIAGGGIAGLAAGWQLAEAGVSDFALLELEDDVGGNARGGRNAISAYPLGAHYLPVQNRESRAIIHLLEKLGMVTGRDEAGRPIYDPLQLCADLDERVLWQGKWHEGLVPSTGLADGDVADLTAFNAAMTRFQAAVGADGRPAFALPIAYSSTDDAYRALDRVDFASWLRQQGWSSPILWGHIRYACRDDYGCEPEHVSAWAGIHYFAGRRGWAADGAGDGLLTWPEGNARLARMMAARFADNIARGRIVWRVARDGTGVVVDSFDVARGVSVRTRARAVILATPHFLSVRIAGDLVPQATGFSYAPWIIANVSLTRPPAGPGSRLAWDNVAFVGESLGYVVANHQTRALGPLASVVTWYMPLSRMEPAAARRLLLERDGAVWRDMVVADLLRSNPDLTGAITHVALWRWGHAMIRPTPGFIHAIAPAARAAVHAPLFLAHSDLSGLSLFEEAHYRGTEAAEAAMRHIGHEFESML